MAEETALVDKKLFTELCAHPNTVVNILTERSVSGTRGTENISREHTATGCLVMGASLQPSKGNTEGLKVQDAQPKQDASYPSSLHSTSSRSSYSLEISLSTNTSINSNKECRPLCLKTSPEIRGGQDHEAKHPSSLICQKPMAQVTKSYSPPRFEPLQEKEQSAGLKFIQCIDKTGTSEIVTSKRPNIESGLEKNFLSSPSADGKVGAQPLSISQPPKATSTEEARKHDIFRTEKQVSQEEEGMFYAFVILHAQEDIEEAVRLKSRLEKISSTTGATFAQDFEIPGQPTFRCVEDAIDNSAFIMLLLTPNFNTRLNETSADSALMNSVEKSHKFNTVIPLLPRTNFMTRDQMPSTLKTKNPLDETKSKNIFEMMAQKVLNSKNIETQKLIWRKAQHLKKEKEKQQRLQEEILHYGDLNREATRVRELEAQVQQLKMQQQLILNQNAHLPNSNQGFPGIPQSFGHMPFQSPCPMNSYNNGSMWQQAPSNIHIQNASCIMIGNNSTMTVGGAVDCMDEENL